MNNSSESGDLASVTRGERVKQAEERSPVSLKNLGEVSIISYIPEDDRSPRPEDANVQRVTILFQRTNELGFREMLTAHITKTTASQQVDASHEPTWEIGITTPSMEPVEIQAGEESRIAEFLFLNSLPR